MKKLTKKEVLELYKKEIEWCEKNPDNMPEEWRAGFVQGLKQAVKLLKAL